MVSKIMYSFLLALLATVVVSSPTLRYVYIEKQAAPAPAPPPSITSQAGYNAPHAPQTGSTKPQTQQRSPSYGQPCKNKNIEPGPRPAPVPANNEPPVTSASAPKHKQANPAYPPDTGYQGAPPPSHAAPSGTNYGSTPHSGPFPAPAPAPIPVPIPAPAPAQMPPQSPSPSPTSSPQVVPGSSVQLKNTNASATGNTSLSVAAEKDRAGAAGNSDGAPIVLGAQPGQAIGVIGLMNALTGTPSV